MKHLNNYILEKLKINKDSKVKGLKDSLKDYIDDNISVLKKDGYEIDCYNMASNNNFYIDIEFNNHFYGKNILNEIKDKLSEFEHDFLDQFNSMQFQEIANGIRYICYKL